MFDVGLVVVLILIVAVATVAVSLGNDEKEEGPTITYVGNGGTTQDHKATYQTRGTQLQDCRFTNSGYVFCMWNMKADGTGTIYSENDRIYPNDYGGYDDQTVYAIWGYPLENVTLVGEDKVLYADGGLSYSINDSNGLVRITYNGYRVPSADVIPAEKITMFIGISPNMYGWTYDEDAEAFIISNDTWHHRIDVQIQNAIINGSTIYQGVNNLRLDFVPTGPVNITVVYS